MSSLRIAVMGASGMLGHEAIRVLAPDFEVWGACRTPASLPDLGLPSERILGGLDATASESARALIERVRPDVVLNAVGIVKQRAEAHAAIPSISINSLWPHVLAAACAERGVRLVHVSTDCVFSGLRGPYSEGDVPDPTDLYGSSKLLGEVTGLDNAVTVRTSMIGWQLGDPTGLVGWFAAHRGERLKGLRRAVFSGLTTRALSRAIRDVILPDETISGLWHMSADPIDKHTLLTKLAAYLGWQVELEPVDEPVIDRSLDSSRLRTLSGWTPPTWDEMLAELAAEYGEA